MIYYNYAFKTRLSLNWQRENSFKRRPIFRASAQVSLYRFFAHSWKPACNSCPGSALYAMASLPIGLAYIPTTVMSQCCTHVVVSGSEPTVDAIFSKRARTSFSMPLLAMAPT